MKWFECLVCGEGFHGVGFDPVTKAQLPRDQVQVDFVVRIAKHHGWTFHPLTSEPRCPRCSAFRAAHDADLMVPSHA